VRERLAAGQPVSGLLPPAVIAYIDHHSLYQAAKDAT
jgi:nicotinic acid mononucleotide adenylyltransferase